MTFFIFFQNKFSCFKSIDFRVHFDHFTNQKFATRFLPFTTATCAANIKNRVFFAILIFSFSTLSQFFDKNGKGINLQEGDLEKIEFRIGLVAYIASYIRPSATLEGVINFLKRIGLLSFSPNAVLQAIHQTLELSAGEDSKNMPIGVLVAETEYIENAGVDEEVFGGFDQITDHLSINLDIKLNTPVTKIDYSSKKIKVFSSKQVYVADAVVVTVPLGVLQKNLIEFVPELPEKKKDAVKNINWGNVNKVIFKFPYSFWGDDKMFFIEREDRHAFSTWFNNEVMVNEPVIYSIISGDYSREIEKKSDEYIIEEAMKPLKIVYGEEVIF